MQFFELVFLLMTTLMLIFLSFGDRKQQQWCFLIGLMVLIFHLAFEVSRWQMGLCFLVFIFMALMLMKPSRSWLVFRLLGVFIGLSFIAISAFYLLMMPIIELPRPDGPLSVGTINYTLTDSSRNESHTWEVDDKRELYMEVWYPADLDPMERPPAVATLWQELYKGELDVVSFFMSYLKGIETHSNIGVPPNLHHSPYPVVLFNHGLQMFAAQNTLLMEHLASHGYVVVSIAHPYESLRVNLTHAGTVLPEFITSWEKFSQAMEWIKKSSAPILAAKDSIENIPDQETRAEIMLKAMEGSEMNGVVSEWEEDTRFVLDNLVKPAERPISFRSIIDTSKIGIMGMSVGGATATEFCKTDGRIKAAINIDGLQYGKRNHIGLQVPYMMVYSKDGADLNEFLMLDSKSDFHQYTFPNARHADFTDMTLIWPVMRVYGQLGGIPGSRMVDLLNMVVLNFWDHYLKEKPLMTLEESSYPEFKVTIQR